MKRFVLSLTVLSLMFIVGYAQAVIIDFEDLAVPIGGQINPPAGVGVVSQGFNYAPGPLGGPLNDIHIHHNLNGLGPKNGTNVGGTHDDVVVTHIGNIAFSLASFDYAGFNLPELLVSVVGTFQGGGNIFAAFAPDNVNDGPGPLVDFETFNLGAGWINLTSVSFQDGQNFVLDNIVVTPVPEPSTYLLFSLGILCIIGMGYRQRKKAA